MSLLRPHLLCLLLGSLAASCHLQLPPEAQFKHLNDAAYAKQEALLQAESISLTNTAWTANDSTHTYLELLIMNPHSQPAAPDSLDQRVRKLVRLLADDLANPEKFESIQVRVQTDHDYIIAQTSEAKNLEYSLKTQQWR